MSKVLRIKMNGMHSFIVRSNNDDIMVSLMYLMSLCRLISDPDVTLNQARLYLQLSREVGDISNSDLNCCDKSFSRQKERTSFPQTRRLPSYTSEPVICI